MIILLRNVLCDATLCATLYAVCPQVAPQLRIMLREDGAKGAWADASYAQIVMTAGGRSHLPAISRCSNSRPHLANGSGGGNLQQGDRIGSGGPHMEMEGSGRFMNCKGSADIGISTGSGGLQWASGGSGKMQAANESTPGLGLVPGAVQIGPAIPLGLGPAMPFRSAMPLGLPNSSYSAVPQQTNSLVDPRPCDPRCQSNGFG